MYKIDLNSDLGEGAAFDAQIIPLITGANIACGFHAGGSEIMDKTIDLCRALRSALTRATPTERISAGQR